MDRDTFVARHQSTWQQLDALTKRRKLSPTEADQLVRLYLRTSSHLATARRRYSDPALLLHLNAVVSRANARIYGTRARTLRALRGAVTRTFPAAVWHARRPVVVAAAVFIAAGLFTGVWLTETGAALDVAIPPEAQEALLDSEFENYYSEQPAGQFATMVFTNNARVGALAFAVGILLGLPTLLVLGYNGLHVGSMAALFHAADRAPQFWGLILPHGLPELTAVFIAGGAGLRLGWALIDPGDRFRRDAVAEEGRRAVVIVIGLVAVFFLSALIEAFVTPSGLPTWARVGTGIVAELTLLGYIIGFGRTAAAEGYTGALGEERRAGARTLQAATG